MNTARIEGTVTDQTGAAVPTAEITTTNIATNLTHKVSSNDKGEYVIPALQAGTYRISVNKSGFRVASIEGIVLNSGVPASVNVRLEIGQTTEVVEVAAGAEIVQTATAAVSSTIGGDQLFRLPFATRNAVELLVSQPGVQTPPTRPRDSSVNGLPRSSLNVSIDGMNTQDNMLKSSDGFFSYIYPSVDALEELTVTSAAGNADSSGQGAVQIKFVTKSGSNQWHGGGFYQKRQTGWNANYFFNNQNSQPRDVIKLTQRGLHAGGPIWKDKAFFFVNYEQYKLPGTKSYDRTILTDTARNGIYTYCPTGTTSTQCIADPSLLKTVNVYTLAAQGGFTSTPDPILAKTFADISATKSAGVVKSRQASNNDWNRETLNFQPSGNQMRHFFTTRLDYNITSKHALSFVYNYDKYDSTPDFLNDTVDAFPGCGVVLCSKVQTGQRSNRFMGVFSVRSQMTSTMTNEFRAGVNGGTVLFFDALNGGLYAPWKGYRPVLPFSLSNVYTTTSAQRRNSPVKDIADNIYWLHGSHQLQLGGTFTQINSFQQIAGTQTMPSITFGYQSGDPIQTGSTNIFNGTTIPGASSTQWNEARDLYIALTGRVSGISKTSALDEKTLKYAAVPPTDRNRMREFGLYFQDAWRARRNLTMNYGLRFEKQGAFENLNGTYARVGYDSLWGVSGIGNMFKPGTLTGKAPTFVAGDNNYAPPSVWAPSLGFAYQVPQLPGIIGKIFGTHDGASVLRAGYSISTIREGQNLFINIWGSNQGRTQTESVNPVDTPTDFGAPGSVLFRNPSFPVKSGLLAAPAFPRAAEFSTSLNDFEPNLSLGYVQSWNIGWQRELTKNMVMEARYVGNHGVHIWRQVNLNEINIVENGFLNEFKIAQNNLRIARGGDITQNTNITNFGNQGLAGQANIPILQTAIGNTTDSSTVTYLLMGSAGSSANSIATNATRMGRLNASTSTACNGAPCPVNMFVVNPTVAGAGAYLVNNTGSSLYDALQLELRRRMTAGLSVQANYTWSKSLANGPTNSSSSSSQPNTFRNLGLSKGPSGYDITHALKANWMYEFPIGHNKRFLGSLANPIVKRIVEGWATNGVVRIQSGLPFTMTGGNGTFNSNGSGVVLNNMTVQDLKDMAKIRKTTGADLKGIVYYLPDDFIANSQAAFNTNSRTPAQVDKSKPYISPPQAGQIGWLGTIYLPWVKFFDASVTKNTTILEGKTLEFRATALNVLNMTQFSSFAGMGSSFGQVTGAYRDISGTVEPGGRVLEFMLRFNF